MTPRSEIIWIDLEDDMEENKERIINSKRSIFPVAAGELDDFIGVVQAKDLLSEIFSGNDVDIKGTVKNIDIKELYISNLVSNINLSNKNKELRCLLFSN